MTSKRKLEYWVIPPEADAEFVANMEEVLDVYERPYRAECPVICMDEQPVQLIGQKYAPIEDESGKRIRMDYEYRRAGMACIFLFCEPLRGWRQVCVKAQRTKTDWAQQVAAILDGPYAHCDKITLVCDNLNTHTKEAFYEAFEPARVRAYVRRIEFCYTSKHGSWLNIAESELSAMTRQSLKGERIETMDQLQQQLNDWSEYTNEKQRGVDWQMRIDDARSRLKSICPKIQL